MDSVYWKVLEEEEAREILDLFTPDGKRRWKVMPMGDLNADQIFVAMTTKLKMEWDTLSKQQSLKNISSKIISEQLLAFFRTVLEILKHHRATLKLKKCKRFQDMCKFLGMDLAAGETKPAQSKNEAFPT